MKLIIDIDEEYYDFVKDYNDVTLSKINRVLYESVSNGIPLEDERPKKHIQRTDCACYDEEYCELYDCGECGIIDEMEYYDDNVIFGRIGYPVQIQDNDRKEGV